MGLTRSVAKRFVDYGNPDSLASRFRRRRIGPLLDLVREAHARYGRVRLLDIGGTQVYWTILPANILHDYNVRITLVNSSDGDGPVDNERFSSITADGCDLKEVFPDRAFDVVHSNSVIEHVGNWQRMSAFAAQVRRLAPAYFVQTPNFWFPVEPHFMSPLFHWLPEPVRVALVRRFDLGNRKRQPEVGRAVEEVESVRLLNKHMLTFLFPDGRLIVERVMALPKSLIVVRGFDAA